MNIVGLVFAGALTWSAHAGPIIVGTGAGGSEFSLIFARANFVEMARDCFASSCTLTPTERTLAPQILLRAAKPPPLLFKTERDMPGLLKKMTAGAVWFNQDRLWLDAKKTVAYDVPEAAAQWLDVLIGDIAPASSALGAKISESLRQRMSRQTRATGDGGTFELLHWRPVSGVDRLFVRDPALNSVDLTAALTVSLACPSLNTLTLFSPTFSSITDLGPDRLLFTVGLGLRWNCGGVTRSESGYVLIYANKNASGAWEFDPATIDAEVPK
jgi:hypothetical protein